MLKKPFPYHRGPTKQTLEECTILRRFYSDVSPKENAEEPPKDKDDDPEGEGFPKVRPSTRRRASLARTSINPLSLSCITIRVKGHADLSLVGAWTPSPDPDNYMSRNNNSFNDKLTMNMVNIYMHKMITECESFPL